MFVGTSPDGDDAEAEMALEHSIRSRATQPVDFCWMRLTREPSSPWFSDGKGGGWDTKSWVTPFSGFRWRIPEVCAHKGRAIYMDVDMLCVTDIAELWEMPMPKGACVLAREAKRYCVMLIDCKEAGRHNPFLSVRRRSGGAVAPFPPGQNWNCLDGDGLPLSDPSIKLLHFTSIDSQPHLPLARARLVKEGRKHWYDGPVRPHWRQELMTLWHREYDAGLASGLTLKGRRGKELFGPFPKRALTVYSGLRPS